MLKPLDEGLSDGVPEFIHTGIFWIPHSKLQNLLAQARPTNQNLQEWGLGILNFSQLLGVVNAH